MMAGNPNSLYPSHDQFVQLGSSSSSSSSSSSIPLNSLPDHTQEPAQSWSQFLLGGLSSEEDRLRVSNFQTKKLENWEEDEILNNQVLQTRLPHHFVDVVKQEELNLQKCNLYGQGDHEELMQSSRHINNNKSTNNWLQVMPVSSPVRSCITTTNNLGTTTNINNILDFSFNNNKLANARHNPTPDQSSECNSTASGGVCKKARVQPTSTQPPLKVRKEKLGDRITALHQLVSPFGKTDTASVLLEAIGYIRFLQSQIEALSSPYLGNGSKHTRTQHYVENGEKAKDLSSRGLCLVPLSCTQYVGSDNIGADYWAPACDDRF